MTPDTSQTHGLLAPSSRACLVTGNKHTYFLEILQIFVSNTSPTKQPITCPKETTQGFSFGSYTDSAPAAAE